MNRPTSPLAIACADIGSVATGRFGWMVAPALSTTGQAGSPTDGSDIDSFVTEVARAIQRGRVALGFECPLWVPVADKEQPTNLTASRCVDLNPSRPWSAGAGAAVLTTGLTEVAWILDRLKGGSDEGPPVFFDWNSFRTSDRGVFLWEAFVSGGVSGSAKGAGPHVDDAAVAVEEFRRRIGPHGTDDPTPAKCKPHCAAPNCKDKEGVRTRSLIGAALLWAGWSSDANLLHRQCVVVRTTKGPAGAASPKS